MAAQNQLVVDVIYDKKPPILPCFNENGSAMNIFSPYKADIEMNPGTNRIDTGFSLCIPVGYKIHLEAVTHLNSRGVIISNTGWDCSYENSDERLKLFLYNHRNTAISIPRGACIAKAYFQKVETGASLKYKDTRGEEYQTGSWKCTSNED